MVARILRDLVADEARLIPPPGSPQRTPGAAPRRVRRAPAPGAKLQRRRAGRPCPGGEQLHLARRRRHRHSAALRMRDKVVELVQGAVGDFRVVEFRRGFSPRQGAARATSASSAWRLATRSLLLTKRGSVASAASPSTSAQRRPHSRSFLDRQDDRLAVSAGEGTVGCDGRVPQHAATACSSATTGIPSRSDIGLLAVPRQRYRNGATNGIWALQTSRESQSLAARRAAPQQAS